MNTMQQMIQMRRQGVTVAEIARRVGLRYDDVFWLLGDTPNEQRPASLESKLYHAGQKTKQFHKQTKDEERARHAPKNNNPNKREHTTCACGRRFYSKSHFNRKCPRCTRASPSRVSRMVERFRTKAKNPSIGRGK